MGRSVGLMDQKILLVVWLWGCLRLDWIER